MHKIADASELESELKRLLAYSQTERPSRSRIAKELQSLSERLAGSISQYTRGIDLGRLFDLVQDAKSAGHQGDEPEAMSMLSQLDTYLDTIEELVADLRRDAQKAYQSITSYPH